jgi:uncharacterized Zn finger protein (UPF0148 family)
MFCPECGAPNDDDSVYCGNCGAPMDPDATPAMAEDKAPEVESVEELHADALEQGPEGAPDAEEALDADEPSVVPAPLDPPPAVERAAVVQTSGMAIASLVMGIAGWTLFPFLGSILAVVFGYAARREIRSQPEQLTGDGLAIAGLVLGWLMIGLSVVGLILGAVGLCFFATVSRSAAGF